MASRGARIRCWPSGTLAAAKLCGTGGDIGRAQARLGLSSASDDHRLTASDHTCGQRPSWSLCPEPGRCSLLPADLRVDAETSRRIVGLLASEVQLQRVEGPVVTAHSEGGAVHGDSTLTRGCGLRTTSPYQSVGAGAKVEGPTVMRPGSPSFGLCDCGWSAVSLAGEHLGPVGRLSLVSR